MKSEPASRDTGARGRTSNALPRRCSNTGTGFHGKKPRRIGEAVSKLRLANTPGSRSWGCAMLWVKYLPRYSPDEPLQVRKPLWPMPQKLREVDEVDPHLRETIRDLIGGKIELANAVWSAGSGGLIQSVVITDLAKQSITKDVIFFDADPTGTTFTENGAFDIHDADLVRIIGVASVSTRFPFNDNSFGGAFNLAIPFVLAGTSLFVAVVERGAGNYVSTSDLTLRVGILQG